jgi:uncharacterized membrane protein
VAALGVNGLLLVGLPVLITEVCAILVERAQPRNLFVYIFCSGFFPAALTVLICLPVALGVLWLDGRFAMPEWLSDFIGYLWFDDVSGGIHQRYGDQRLGGVLPGLAGNVQPHPVFAGAVEG